MAKQVLGIPVKQNQIIELDIHGMSHEGEGVGKYEGFTVFVPGALTGEQVRVQIIKVHKSFAVSRLLEVVTPSDVRTAPLCSIYHQCGGCHLQHVSYEAQLVHKRQIVVDALERIGKLSHVAVHPTLGMKEPWKYRNKSQVPVSLVNGRVVAGFYAPRTHEIIDMEGCPIQHPYADDILQTVKQAIAELGIVPYDEIGHKGLIRHIVSRIGFFTGDTMVVLVTNGRQLPKKERLIERLRREIPHLVSIVQNINTAKTNVIFGPESITLWGKDAITDYIGDIQFEISPRSFFQVNPVQTRVLYEKALEYAQLTGGEEVIDAYCGIGTISLFLAKKAKHVYGVEVIPEAIEDAKKNASLNGISNVNFIVGKAEEVIPTLYKEKGVSADVVVVDPPRKGCDEALLQTIANMRPERVVYVSCNPSTLARDLRYLEDHGYQTLEVQPVDMFPQTYHVEAVASVVRKD
jgi:23S rRNA (uracil1939-C5)-methyltransferase